MRWTSPLAACLLLAGTAGADLSKVDRSIPKEPAYKTKAQKYALLVVGPEAKQRLWLVLDGDELHVLGDKPAKLAGKQENDGLVFKLEEVTVGGAKHRDLTVGVAPLKKLAADDHADRPDVRAALKRDPDATAMAVCLDMVAPHIKKDGHVKAFAGWLDLNGPVVLAAKPAEAPVFHFGGPLEVTFFRARPSWKRGISSDAVTVVGTPGLGAGTFAMLAYDGVVPPAAHPRLDVTFAADDGVKPVKEHFELKQRC